MCARRGDFLFCFPSVTNLSNSYSVKNFGGPQTVEVLSFLRFSHLGFMCSTECTGDDKKSLSLAGTWGIGRNRLPHTVYSYRKIIF